MKNSDSADITVLGCSTVEDLKSLGSFKAVRALAQQILGSHLRLSARGWADLLRAVQDARNLAAEPEAAYFTSPAAEAIFYLLELDGESRRRKLGITARHMADKAAAKSWRDSFVRLIHPDRCKHPGAERAMAKLNEIYAAMVEA